MNAFYRFVTRKPLKFLYHSFHDRVTGKMVNVYEDEIGQRFLSTSQWGWDRMPKE